MSGFEDYERRIEALRNPAPAWIEEDRMAREEFRAMARQKGWLSGAIGITGADDNFNRYLDEADASNGPIVVRIYCEQCGADGRRRAIAHLHATQHGLLFKAKRPFPAAVAALRADAELAKIANKAHTFTLALLNPPLPDPRRRVPMVHCEQHGEAVVDPDVLRRAAGKAPGRVVVRCSE